MDARGGRRLLELLVGRVGAGEAKVLAHAAVKQVGVLRDDADDAPERCEAEVAHIGVVEQHRALADVVEACDQVPERGLPASGLADDRDLGARLCGEGHVLEHRALGLVRERDAVQAHLAAHAFARKIDGVLPLADVDGQVEVLEMRSNSASDDCTSACTLSRLPTGKKSRVCMVVNATSVPTETSAQPLAIAYPATP